MKTLIILLLLISSSHAEDSIVYIGDSQSVGHLGKFIYNHLKRSSPNKEIHVYGIGSSSPRHWSAPINSKNGSWLCERSGRYNDQRNIPLRSKVCQGDNSKSALSYLVQDKPEWVIFQFLGNSVGFNEFYISKKVKQMLAQIGDQKCLFITSPPYFHALVERNKLRFKTEQYFLKAIAKRCEVAQGMTEQNFNIFSKDSGHYLKDKIHLSFKGAEIFFKQFQHKIPQ
ncbi:MAG: SGNH/GDSL hydrolase family protein [Bacteriovoracaceae bacterium]|jgi:hypothetical protein|nr:SGNH/GDSL hydrolase family protein [Bacteriovoracaceae bacterium]